MKTGSYTIDLAGPRDDEELRRLLRDNPMPGDISLTLEREPSFFLGAAIEGAPHQTYIGRDGDGRVVGLASRSIRTAFVNGVAARVGYLSQARLDHRYRGTRSLLRGGFRFLRELHDDGAAAFYVTSIIADNRVARRFFEADWPGKPTYQPWARYSTLALPLLRRRRARLAGIEVRHATDRDTDVVVALLQRNLARFQLAPVWSREELTGEATRDLRVSDFLVAARRNEPVGCLALWDQSGFKQSVVRGYGGRMALARPWVNAAARVLATPRLPDPGQPIASRFLSHVAVDADDVEVLRALVESAYDEALATRAFSFVTIGFATQHRFAAAIRELFRVIEYPSQLYLVYWPDGREAAAKLDDRLPHLEAATL